MPNTQQQTHVLRRSTPEKKQQARNKKRRDPNYRMRDVGYDVALQSKTAKDGTLIVRLVPIREKEEAVRMNGRQQVRKFRHPAPGSWIAMRDINIDALFDLMEALEREAQKREFEREAAKLPLTHQPLNGLLDIVPIFVDGVKRAYNEHEQEEEEPKPKPRKRKGKKKKAPKPKPTAEAAAPPACGILSRLDALVARSEVFRRRMGELRTEA